MNMNGRVFGAVWRIFTGGTNQSSPNVDSSDHHQAGHVSEWWQSMGDGHVDRPFIGRVPRPLRVGDKITITGTIAEDAELFSINLCCDTSNVAYHSKVLFQENVIRTNFKINGSWGDEDGEVNNPFQQGGDFKITLIFMEDEIYMYDGDSYIHQFQYQHSIEDIDTVQVWHHVKHVKEITFTFAE